MDKYKLLSIIEISQVIYILGVIALAGIFRNWWLLFLILLVGTTEYEEKILNSNRKSK